VAHGAAAMRDLPLLHPTGDLLLCGLLADDAASRMPFCCISAWQLAAGQQGQGQGQGQGRQLQEGDDSTGGSGGVVRVASLSPRKQARPAGSTAAAAAAAAGEEGGSSSGAGSCSAAAAATPQPSSVMLVVGEEDRQGMISVLEDTQHKISSLLTTPRHLVYTTDMGHVFVQELLPVAGAP
jgi:hypothetical protein